MIESRPTADESWRRGTLRPPAAAGSPTAAWLVVKIGGSLLSRPGWPTLLSALLDELGPRPCRIVVGGGAIVDGLRAVDRAAPQPAAVVHELAIDAMRLTARLAAVALGLPLETAANRAVPLAVLDAPAWLAETGWTARLPAGWEVTSDTIAACVGVTCGGGLLLVKSVPPPPCRGGDPVAAAAAAGWVDGHFPVAAARLAEIGWAAPGRA